MYLFLPGESGCLRRKFACFSCDSCKEGGWRTASDDYRGNLECETQQNIKVRLSKSLLREVGTLGFQKEF